MMSTGRNAAPRTGPHLRLVAQPRDTTTPRWLRWSTLMTCLVVLATHVFYIAGLMRAGVGWTDGESAYGVTGADASDVLPPGLADVVAVLTVFVVLFGPLAVACIAAAAAVSVKRSWRTQRDHLSLVTLASAVAVFGLLGFWGDELWVWFLD